MIEVHVPLKELCARDYTITSEAFTLAKLRSAGVPVKGVLLFRGVEHGTLTWFYNPYTGDETYRWVDDNPVNDKGQRD